LLSLRLISMQLFDTHQGRYFKEGTSISRVEPSKSSLENAR